MIAVQAAAAVLDVKRALQESQGHGNHVGRSHNNDNINDNNNNNNNQNHNNTNTTNNNDNNHDNNAGRFTRTDCTGSVLVQVHGQLHTCHILPFQPIL